MRLLACIVGSVASLATQSGATKPDVTVRLQVTRSLVGRPIVHVSLTNDASTPLDVYKSRLPWENRYSMILVAVEATSPHPVLKAPFPIDDPTPQRVRIESKETLKGTVDLEERFPGITRALQSHEIVLFWSYQVRSVTDDVGERLGGFAVIPAEKGPP
jgi:hypothetical protein